MLYFICCWFHVLYTIYLSSIVKEFLIRLCTSRSNPKQLWAMRVTVLAQGNSRLTGIHRVRVWAMRVTVLAQGNSRLTGIHRVRVWAMRVTVLAQVNSRLTGIHRVILANHCATMSPLFIWDQFPSCTLSQPDTVPYDEVNWLTSVTVFVFVLLFWYAWGSR